MPIVSLGPFDPIGGIGGYSLGLCRVDVGGPLGDFTDASFNIEASPRIIGGGYPKVAQAVLLESVKAAGSVSITEVGGPVKALANKALQAAGGTDGGDVDVALGVYYPFSGVSDISFSAKLIPQMEASFSDGESNSIKIYFEAIVSDLDALNGLISGGGGGGGAGGGVVMSAPSWLLDPGNLAAGSLVVNGESCTSCNIRLSSEMKRIELGVPKLCKGLIPMSSTLEVEWTTTGGGSGPSINQAGSVDVQVQLLSGNLLTFQMSGICTGGGPNLSKGSGGMSYKYTAVCEGGAPGSFG